MDRTNCKHCTLKGDAKECSASTCAYHKTFHAATLAAQLAEVTAQRDKAVGALREVDKVAEYYLSAIEIDQYTPGGLDGEELGRLIKGAICED